MQRRDVINEDQFEEDLKHFADLAVRMGALDAKVIDAKNVVVEDWSDSSVSTAAGIMAKH